MAWERMMDVFNESEKPIKVTFDKKKRLYKKCIGTHVGADSVVRARIFWLGDNQVVAVHKAKVFRRCWMMMNMSRPTHWTAASEKWAEDAYAQERLGVTVLANQARRTLQRLAGQGVIAPEPSPTAPPLPQTGNDNDVVTVASLEAKYIEYAEGYYIKSDGSATGEVKSIKLAMKPLKALYARTPVAEFGPLALKAIREAMLAKGWCRSYVNQQVGRIRRMFKWGVESELVPASIFHALEAIAGLRKGRSGAKESDPIRPVPQAHVEAVRQRVSAQVKAIIDLQLLTGMRPGEVLAMRTVDIDRSGKAWVYRPEHHKTEHHDLTREVYLGPKAQEVIKPFLNEKKPEAFMFSPADAEKDRRAKMHDERMTPLSCGNRPGTNKSRKPQRPPGDRYTVASYRRAIARACRKADVEARKDKKLDKDKVVFPAWHPHRLRHNAATRLRKDFGIEAARTILGHRSAAVTEIYAERDAESAKKIMAEVG